MYKLNAFSSSVHRVLSNVVPCSYYLASSAVRSCPWAARRQCCLATQPRCPGNWQSRPCRHCSRHWRHWAGSPLCCAGKCCWWACSWPTYTWRDLGWKEGEGGVVEGGERGDRKGAGWKWLISTLSLSTGWGEKMQMVVINLLLMLHKALLDICNYN